MKNYRVYCYVVTKNGLQCRHWLSVVECNSEAEARQGAIHYFIDILGCAYCRPLKVVEDLPELEVAT